MKSFPMYVATMVALKAARSPRAQLRLPARGLAHAYADPQRSAEERWDGEGGSRSVAPRRDPLEF